jgi:DNA polymerase III subunit gamma/tau
MAFSLNHRPRKISEIFGQSHLKLALSNLLRGYANGDGFPNTIVFQGYYGCGKTTAARILANYVTCDNGPLRACGQCPSCLQLQANQHPNVLERDAATYNSVDDIPELKEWCSYSGRGKRKFLILDEAHRMSGAAFDALLKTLEDGQDNATFMFCTTEENGIPDTVKSRSTPLKIHKLSAQELTDLARFVCAKEGVTIESEQALQHIVRMAKGHARDMLGALESACTLYTTSASTLTDQAVWDMYDLGNMEVVGTAVRSLLTGADINDFAAQSFASGDVTCRTATELLRQELHQRTIMSGSAEIAQVSSSKLVEFLSMLEDTQKQLQAGESFAAIVVAYHRWKAGLYATL